MQDAMTVGLSAQIALEKRLTTIASNIANTRTVGFRAAEVKFNELVERVRTPDDVEAPNLRTWKLAALRRRAGRSISRSRARPGSRCKRPPVSR